MDMGSNMDMGFDEKPEFNDSPVLSKRGEDRIVAQFVRETAVGVMKHRHHPPNV